MERLGLVLVHGGGHDSRCWGPTVGELHRLRPELPVVAVDLPGRDGNPDDLLSYSLESCVTAVVAQVDAAGLDSFVLVGHSAAGTVIPAVAAKLGPERVRRLTFLATAVPPDGGTIIDLLEGPFKRLADRTARRPKINPPLRRPFASLMFCNGMTREQRRFSLSVLCAEAPALSLVPAMRTGLSPDIPRTWVLTLRDRSLKPALQRRMIANLGGNVEVIEMDTCHNLMISQPTRVAEILLSELDRALEALSTS